MEGESIYDHIRQVFGQIQGQCNVLEEQIDVELQLRYFKFGKKIKESLHKDQWMSEKEMLFDPEVDLKKKKELLSGLASIDDVSCFRAIERYRESPDPELMDWSILALQESKMLLQSKLLDEEQVFISTGLGGKGKKLRYFMVLLSGDKKPLEKKHLKIVENEFLFSMKKEDVEIEDIELDEEFIKLLMVIPLQTMIKEIIKEVITECNQYGNFLMDNFIITNVKHLSNEEIRDIIKEDKE